MVRQTLFLLLTLAAGCVYRPVANTQNLSAGDTDLLQCERVNPTGTRLGEVVCLTPEDRERMAAEGRDQLERMQRTSRGATKEPPSP